MLRDHLSGGLHCRRAHHRPRPQFVPSRSGVRLCERCVREVCSCVRGMRLCERCEVVGHTYSKLP